MSPGPHPTRPAPLLRERWTALGEGRGVRSLTAAGTTGSHVVVVPGLGALAYLLPLVRELSRAGHTVSLLDLPGFGTAGEPSTDPTIEGIGRAVRAWVQAEDVRRPVVVGHSTGAQAALAAAVGLRGVRRPTAVVLAGPTVAPGQRRLSRLVARGLLAYRRDSPAELRSLPDYLRARTRLVTMLRDAVRDRPERRVGELTVPLVVTAGRHDAFAPLDWLTTLAAAAARSPDARVVRLPGSHNNPWTHPAPLAALVRAEPTSHLFRSTGGLPTHTG